MIKNENQKCVKSGNYTTAVDTKAHRIIIYPNAKKNGTKDMRAKMNWKTDGLGGCWFESGRDDTSFNSVTSDTPEQDT